MQRILGTLSGGSLVGPRAATSLSFFTGLSSRSIARQRRRPNLVVAMCRSRAATSINAELPSGNAPTTRVRRRISRMIRSSDRWRGSTASAYSAAQPGCDVSPGLFILQCVFERVGDNLVTVVVGVCAVEFLCHDVFRPEKRRELATRHHIRDQYPMITGDPSSDVI